MKTGKTTYPHWLQERGRGKKLERLILFNVNGETFSLTTKATINYACDYGIEKQIRPEGYKGSLSVMKEIPVEIKKEIRERFLYGPGDWLSHIASEISGGEEEISENGRIITTHSLTIKGEHKEIEGYTEIKTITMKNKPG